MYTLNVVGFEWLTLATNCEKPYNYSRSCHMIVNYLKLLYEYVTVNKILWEMLKILFNIGENLSSLSRVKSVFGYKLFEGETNNLCQV